MPSLVDTDNFHSGIVEQRMSCESDSQWKHFLMPLPFPLPEDLYKVAGILRAG